MILGGYVTGQFFYYENAAVSATEPPQASSHRGPLKGEDGLLLDVGWSATPELADLDDDGDLDLISGHIGERKDRFGYA